VLFYHTNPVCCLDGFDLVDPEVAPCYLHGTMQCLYAKLSRHSCRTGGPLGVQAHDVVQAPDVVQALNGVVCKQTLWQGTAPTMPEQTRNNRGVTCLTGPLHMCIYYGEPFWFADLGAPSAVYIWHRLTNMHALQVP
jgi:hypothetical protein